VIKSIRLKNFRRYEDSTFTFADGLNFIEGVNNAGKTTVLYGVEYALFGKVGTNLQPAGLMKAGAKDVGVELVFVGKDGRTYRLQRIHIKPPKSRTKVNGHFTLKVAEEGSEAEKIVLSSDFDDRETQLAEAVQKALGLTKRAYDLAVHLQQGRIAEILNGNPQLDIVLGVTAAVFVEEELRAMALTREKAAAALPALDASLERLNEERRMRKERLSALEAEDAAHAEVLAAFATREASLQEKRDARAPMLDAWRSLSAAEESVTSGRDALDRAREAATEAGSLDSHAATVQGANDAVESATSTRAAAKDAVDALHARTRSLEGKKGDLAGRLERRKAVGSGGMCDHCGQEVDAAHMAKAIPELEAALADLDGQLAATEAETATASAAADAADEALSAARVTLAEAQGAHGRAQAAADALQAATDAFAAANEAAAASRVAAEAFVDPGDGLLDRLAAAVNAARDAIREEEIRIEAEGEHLGATTDRLARERRESEQSLAAVDRDHATTTAEADALRADAALASRLRSLGKAFKAVQQDLREQATASMATRSLELHSHLSGDDKELKALEIDSKRYVVNVTPRDVGAKVPAALYQGGGHRLLLGLAARLALAEQLGPVPFILLDEPTYGLDKDRRAALLSRISDLDVAKQLLLITHHDVGTSGATRQQVVRDGKTSRIATEGAQA